MRNWSAIVVLPVPGVPSIRNMCSRVNPPARMSSRPQIPLFAFSAIDSTKTASQTDDNSPRLQAVPSNGNYFHEQRNYGRIARNLAGTEDGRGSRAGPFNRPDRSSAHAIQAEDFP